MELPWARWDGHLAVSYPPDASDTLLLSPGMTTRHCEIVPKLSRGSLSGSPRSSATTSFSGLTTYPLCASHCQALGIERQIKVLCQRDNTSSQSSLGSLRAWAVKTQRQRDRCWPLSPPASIPSGESQGQAQHLKTLAQPCSVSQAKPWALRDHGSSGVWKTSGQRCSSSLIISDTTCWIRQKPGQPTMHVH